MTIKDNQIQTLKEYINEGISCQNSAPEGKKQYLRRVQEWLGNICKDNKENEPYWIWTMLAPKYYIGAEVQGEDEEEFCSDALAICLQQLNDLHDNYYQQKELEESRAQTMTAMKSLEYSQQDLVQTQQSLKYTQASLRVSIGGLIASILIPVITINSCTNTTKIDEKQFQEITNVHKTDSVHNIILIQNK